MADIFQIVENNGTPKDIGDSKARANIAPTFDVSKANAVGDLVLSDTGILYRFNAAYTAGTSWNSRTSKEQVDIANELNQKVSKSGDTMTGLLNMKNLQADILSPSGESEIGMLILDKNNRKVGIFDTFVRLRNNKKCSDSYIAAINYDDNGNRIDNRLHLYINNDNTGEVSITHPIAWRNALKLNKKLYEVTNTNAFISGSITVPELENYSMYRFIYSDGAVLLAFKDNSSTIFAGMSFGVFNSNQGSACFARYGISSNTLSISNSNRGYYQNGGKTNYDGTVTHGLTHIYGLI